MSHRSFLFVPLGSHGDVHPIVGLALAMKARGHRVVVCTNGFFRKAIERSGLEFVEFGTEQEYLDITSRADIWDPRDGSKAVLTAMASQTPSFYHFLLQRWQQERFTLVASPLCMAARVLHETHGVPLITTQLQPITFRTAYETPGIPVPMPRWAPRWYIRALFWLADISILDPAVCPILNPFRKELGLPPVSHVTDRWWNSPQRVLGLWPDWFAKPQPDWPPQVRLTGFPLYDERDIAALSPELESFLAAGSPPIAFTPGSAMRHGHAFFEAAIGACEQLGRRGILLTRFNEQLPANLPASVVHVAFAPFSLLLPRCAALVHHGGIGTLAQGFAAGIPQLLMPMAHDQPDNLLRLQRLGAGDGLSPESFKAPAVAAKLRGLLVDVRVLRRCKELQQLIQREQPLQTACELLEADLL